MMMRNVARALFFTALLSGLGACKKSDDKTNGGTGGDLGTGEGEGGTDTDQKVSLGPSSVAFDMTIDLCEADCAKWEECDPNYIKRYSNVNQCIDDLCSDNLEDFVAWCGANWKANKYESLEMCKAKTEAFFRSKYSTTVCGEACDYYINKDYTLEACKADCDTFHTDTCANALSAFNDCWAGLTCDGYKAYMEAPKPGLPCDDLACKVTSACGPISSVIVHCPN